MPKVTIRLQKVSDAKRFFEILNSPQFVYFPAKPKTIEEEKKWLKGNVERRKKNTEWNYAILLDGKVVGGIGIKIDLHRNFKGEIGYFVDENFWGRGIATKALHLAEKAGFQKHGLKRIEVLMEPRNVASEKVAVKCKYKKEGCMRKAVIGTDGKMKDVLLYAKVK